MRLQQIVLSRNLKLHFFRWSKWVCKQLIWATTGAHVLRRFAFLPMQDDGFLLPSPPTKTAKNPSISVTAKEAFPSHNPFSVLISTCGPAKDLVMNEEIKTSFILMRLLKLSRNKPTLLYITHKNTAIILEPRMIVYINCRDVILKFLLHIKC